MSYKLEIHHSYLITHNLLLSAENSMNEFGASEVFIVCVVALIFALGVYTLLKFRKMK
ncbi:MAG: hypothetical protein ACYDCN_17110 [Bacteroidia bacterium]